MSTNQPGKPRIKFIDDAGTDTTEGHALKGRGVQEAEVSRGRGIEDAETEGHLARGRGGFDEADTEAHVAKFRGVQPAGDDEDTEGHPFRK